MTLSDTKLMPASSRGVKATGSSVDPYSATALVERYNELKGRRANWDTHWREVARLVLPNQDDVFASNVGGEKKGIFCYDNTPGHANTLLASALHGMLTNPATYWFGLETGIPELDNDDQVRKWLQDASMRIHKILNGSNFQTEIIEVFLALGSIGTWVMFIDEDDERVINFNAKPIYQSFIAENKRGEVDTIFREFKWTKRQIMQEWGGKKKLGNGPSDNWMIEMDKIKEDDEVELLHCVYPRTDYDNNKLPANYKFASKYLLKTASKTISEGGFREFPYVVPRWSKVSGEIYGRSPAMNSLADIKMLQKIMKTQIKGLEKTVDPPLLAPDEGVMLPLKLTPGGVNYYRAGTQDVVKPLQTDARVDYGQKALEDLRDRIKKAFYVDQLQLPDGPQKTATESNIVFEQQLRLMAPVLGRLHHELIRGIVDRCFAIMLRKNLFGKIPAKLSKMKLQIRYSSMIAKAQRSSQAIDLTRGFQTLAPFIQGNPQVMDIFDPDKAAHYVAKIYDWPEEIIRDQTDIDQIRSDRQQAQQAASDAQAKSQQAVDVKNLGPTTLGAAQLIQGKGNAA